MKLSIRVALIVTMDDQGPEATADTLESIRTQTLIPRFVRLIDNSSSVDSMLPEVVEEVRRLRFFSPNVIVIAKDKAHTREAYLAGIKHVMQQHDFDVYLTVAAGTILGPDAVYEMVNPFWDPKIVKVLGVDYGNDNRSKWRRFLDRHIAVLCFKGPNRGSLMANRRNVMEEHLDEWPLGPVQANAQRHATPNKKSSYAKDLDLYY